MLSLVLPGGKTEAIWRMDAGGGHLKQLSDGKRDELPVCSADEKWVYYVDMHNDYQMMRVPLEGGKPEILSKLPVSSGLDVSSDGQLIAFLTFGSSGILQLAFLPANSPQNPKVVDLQRPARSEGVVRLTHDGKGVIYAVRDQDVDNLWLQPLDGSPGKQLTNFKSEHIEDFHWTLDGTKLGMIRGHTDSDVVFLQESKP